MKIYCACEAAAAAAKKSASAADDPKKSGSGTFLHRAQHTALSSPSKLLFTVSNNTTTEIHCVFRVVGSCARFGD